MADWPADYRREVVEEIDSTNKALRLRASEGDSGQIWLSARRQIEGIGRRGRVWCAPEGNLSASLLLRPSIAPAQAALYSFVACLAVADMLAEVSPGAEVKLKWPNDALLNGRKAAGILLESEGGPKVLDWLIIGIGVNLAVAPDLDDAEAWAPTSVAAEAGATPNVDHALTLLAASFDRHARRFEAEGFGPIRAEWIACAARLGEKVTARLPNSEITGVFVDVDEQGALVLNTASGEKRIAAADVYFP